MSPSKTKKINKIETIALKEYKYEDKVTKIIETIVKMTNDEIVKKFKLNYEKSDQLKNFYIDYNNESYGHAIKSYTGLAFKQFENINSDTTNEIIAEFENRLVILSALYGLLNAFDGIKNYRLDMNNSIFNDKTLYKFWQKEIDEYFKDDELIINLASKEYSKMIDKNKLINIEFYEKKDDKLKQVSANSKKIRGNMAYTIIINKIYDIEDIKKIEIDNYKYNVEMSNERNLIFINETRCEI